MSTRDKDSAQIIDFFRRTKALNIELIEQTFSAKKVDDMKALPEDLEKEIAADEALTSRLGTSAHKWK
jgi:L-alanine-DL-glutamate epimerase-like enolase superfamily enzyme